MLVLGEFQELLRKRGTLVIDGALATELESRGYDLSHPLWSAKVLKEDPESIEKVHLDYYLAGADIAITATYQASIEGFRNHFGMREHESLELMKRSVELAQQAREEAYKSGVPPERPLLVAGSVGPYGAYLADGSEYRGNYERTKKEFENFHRPRIQSLVDSGVDLLAIETMPKLKEIEAVLELLSNEFPTTVAWLGCTLRNSRRISDGTLIKDVIELAERHADQVLALGINCVPAGMVYDTVEHMKLYSELPLLCYPNSGEIFDATAKTWSGAAVGGGGLERKIQDWQRAGARLIGGCCRTGPDYISIVSKACKKR